MIQGDEKAPSKPRAGEGEKKEAGAGSSAGEWRDPTAGGATERLARGLHYPFSTLGYMLRRPGLWGYAFLPVLITAVTLLFLLWALFQWGRGITEWIWSQPAEWYFLLLWYPMHVVILVLLFVIGAVTLPGLISSPFNKALSKRTEQMEIGEKVGRGGIRAFFKGLPSALLDELRKIAFLLAVHAVLLVVFLLPFVGQVLYPPIAWAWTVLWLSMQNLGFSFSRHRHPFMDAPRVVRRNLALSMGFGVGVFLMLLIPFFNFAFVPVAVVGGTRLFVDLRRGGALSAPEDAGSD